MSSSVASRITKPSTPSPRSRSRRALAVLDGRVRLARNRHSMKGIFLISLAREKKEGGSQIQDPPQCQVRLKPDTTYRLQLPEQRLRRVQPLRSFVGKAGHPVENRF